MSEIVFWTLVLIFFIYNLIFYGFRELLSYFKVLFFGKKTTAKIVSYHSEITEDNSTFYYPIIEYQIQSGEYLTYQSELSELNESNIGKILSIKYNTNNPREVIVIDFFFVFLHIIGLLFFVYVMILCFKKILQEIQ
jgi:hypothetical protein